jgi:hypothetical protein
MVMVKGCPKLRTKGEGLKITIGIVIIMGTTITVVITI